MGRTVGRGRGISGRTLCFTLWHVSQEQGMLNMFSEYDMQRLCRQEQFTLEKVFRPRHFNHEGSEALFLYDTMVKQSVLSC